MNTNKLIGVLKMGRASTQFYIQLLTELYGHEKPNNVQAFKLITTDFEAINNLLPNRSSKLDAIIASYLRELPLNEIECILIPNITIHETIDAVWDTLDSPIPIAHPLFGTIKRMHIANNNKAVLFGTSYTMTSDYIKTVFANSDIVIEQPKSKDLEFIDWVRRQVYSESASLETIKSFNDLIKKYSNETTVLIACTELSLASSIVNERILDMAMIQVENAISIIRT